MKLIYENPLASEQDIAGFHMEGDGAVTFPRGRMRLRSTRDPGPDSDQAANQLANIVYWCPQDFPDNIAISWNFWPIAEPGLCILFFSATGQQGQDIRDPRLAPRSGPYGQYHHGDINALHVSYFRRRYADDDRRFHTCNLRKSHGFHLVAQGPDPIPDVADAVGPYAIELTKAGADVTFSINGMRIFQWHDDGRTHGPVLGGGKIGFRQMAPMVGEYANLKVTTLG